MNIWRELKREDLDNLYGKVEIRFFQDHRIYEKSEWISSKACKSLIKLNMNAGVKYQYKYHSMKITRQFSEYLFSNVDDLEMRLRFSVTDNGRLIYFDDIPVEIMDE